MALNQEYKNNAILNSLKNTWCVNATHQNMANKFIHDNKNDIIMLHKLLMIHKIFIRRNKFAVKIFENVLINDVLYKKDNFNKTMEIIITYVDNLENCMFKIGNNDYNFLEFLVLHKKKKFNKNIMHYKKKRYDALPIYYLNDDISIDFLNKANEIPVDIIINNLYHKKNIYFKNTILYILNKITINNEFFVKLFKLNHNSQSLTNNTIDIILKKINYNCDTFKEIILYCGNNSRLFLRYCNDHINKINLIDYIDIFYASNFYISSDIFILLIKNIKEIPIYILEKYMVIDANKYRFLEDYYSILKIKNFSKNIDRFLNLYIEYGRDIKIIEQILTNRVVPDLKSSKCLSCTEYNFDDKLKYLLNYNLQITDEIILRMMCEGYTEEKFMFYNIPIDEKFFFLWWIYENSYHKYYTRIINWDGIIDDDFLAVRTAKKMNINEISKLNEMINDGFRPDYYCLMADKSNHIINFYDPVIELPIYNISINIPVMENYENMINLGINAETCAKKVQILHHNSNNK